VLLGEVEGRREVLWRLGGRLVSFSGAWQEETRGFTWDIADSERGMGDACVGEGAHG
jgi:hypothetical protein